MLVLHNMRIVPSNVEKNKETIEYDKSTITGTQLLALYSGSLFDWSRAWGLTHTISLPEFI